MGGWYLPTTLLAVRIYYNRTGYYLMPVFAAYVAVWCSYFVEKWKGLQATTAMEWGVTGECSSPLLDLQIYSVIRRLFYKGFESGEAARIQFVGEETTSPVDGSRMLYYSADNQIATGLLSVVSGLTVPLRIVTKLTLTSVRRR